MIARFGFLSLLFLSVQGFVKPTPPSTFVSKSAIHAADEVAEVKVGDTLPDVVLMQGQEDYGPPVEVKLSELVAGKKVAIFGVPGAFTPGCSKSHLPSFIEAQDALKDKDVELTICVATNDAFVMEVRRTVLNAVERGWDSVLPVHTKPLGLGQLFWRSGCWNHVSK